MNQRPRNATEVLLKRFGEEAVEENESLLRRYIYHEAKRWRFFHRKRNQPTAGRGSKPYQYGSFKLSDSGYSASSKSNKSTQVALKPLEPSRMKENGNLFQKEHTKADSKRLIQEAEHSDAANKELN
jgi:hypothetical protein